MSISDTNSYQQLTNHCPTVYMAPEVLKKNNYTEKADIYSYAIVLIELLTGNKPYGAEECSQMNQAQLMYHIIENNLRPSLEGLHPSLQQLISDCWNIDPNLRPSFAEIVVRLKRLKGILHMNRSVPLTSFEEKRILDLSDDIDDSPPSSSAYVD